MRLKNAIRKYHAPAHTGIFTNIFRFAQKVGEDIREIYLTSHVSYCPEVGRRGKRP